MAEEAPSALGDFFAKKGKKKVKASNLNVAPVAKTEEIKKKKDADEAGWAEEEVVAPTLTGMTVGNLTRDEDKKDDEENLAPAWNSTKSKASAITDVKLQNRFPTLAKSTRLNNTNINVDDGKDDGVNIKTSKNAFSALDGEDDGPKKVREIKPAMVTKAKGEFEAIAVKREVDKHTKAKTKKKKVKEGSDSESGSEEEEEEEAEEEEKAAPVRREKKKKVVEEKAEEPEEEEEKAEDLKIKPDDEEKAYEIEVDKSSGEVFLGLTWKVTSTGFEIQTLDDDGLIAKWNKDNDDKVKVYDLIVAVNDEGEADDMREELKKAQKLEIELVSASAIKNKYKGRRRLPPVKLSAEELRDPTKEAKSKPQAAAAGGKKKKFANFEQDDKKTKLQYLEE